MREPTAIPSTTAWLLSAFFAVSYVASVYALPGARLVYKTQQVETGPDAARARAQNELSRNDPSVIKSRLIGVSLATLSAISVVYAVVTKAGSWDVSSNAKVLQFIERILSGGI
jgi:prenyl protein peptidase